MLLHSTAADLVYFLHIQDNQENGGSDEQRNAVFEDGWSVARFKQRQCGQGGRNLLEYGNGPDSDQHRRDGPGNQPGDK